MRIDREKYPILKVISYVNKNTQGSLTPNKLDAIFSRYFSTKVDSLIPFWNTLLSQSDNGQIKCFYISRDFPSLNDEDLLTYTDLLVKSLDEDGRVFNECGCFLNAHSDNGNEFSFLYTVAMDKENCINFEIHSFFTKNKKHGFLGSIKMSKMGLDFISSNPEMIMMRIYLMFMDVFLAKEFIDIEENDSFLSPANKQETPQGQADKYNDITTLDRSWFTRVNRTEAFRVRGHIRKQPCGPGKKDIRLVFVRGHQKNGYKRRARKEIANQ